jgi:protein gp37
MGDKTNIAYCDATWNPVVGCSHESTGCVHCFAERTASSRFLKGSEAYVGLTENGHWTGEIRLLATRLPWPMRKRRSRVIFTCDMGDLFHPSVPFDYIAAVYGVMAACPQHTFLVLTKRVERRFAFFKWVKDNIDNEICLHTVANLRMVGYETGCGSAFDPDLWPLPNVWEGFTAENQDMFERRLPVAVMTPAEHRWVSIEPQVGPITTQYVDIHQIICGGESGPKARPFDLGWARALRDDCDKSRVPFYFKQAGSNAFDKTVFVDGRFVGGVAHAFKHRSGADPFEWPADLYVRKLAWAAGSKP